MATPPKTPQKAVSGKPLPAAAAAAKKPTLPKATKPEKAARAERAAKPAVKAPQKREKLVRDSFTVPKGEYTVLDDLKQRAIALTRPAKKSELVRAGIKALASMNDASFLAALRSVPSIKTGRPPGAATVAAAPAPKVGKS